MEYYIFVAYFLDFDITKSSLEVGSFLRQPLFCRDSGSRRYTVITLSLSPHSYAATKQYRVYCKPI